MKKMSLYSMSQINELAWPEQAEELSLDSDAELFFTDFKKVRPQIIEASTSALDAKKVMIQTHVRLLFVVDDAGHIVGVVSADDLIERKIVQRVSEGYHRESIQVTDLMTDKKRLKALDMDAVGRAKISDVIDVLKDSHQQHCLVIDNESHQVRGIFSASDISRKLKLRIDIEHRSHFYRVFEVIA